MRNVRIITLIYIAAMIVSFVFITEKCPVGDKPAQLSNANIKNAWHPKTSIIPAIDKQSQLSVIIMSYNKAKRLEDVTIGSIIPPDIPNKKKQIKFKVHKNFKLKNIRFFDRTSRYLTPEGIFIYLRGELVGLSERTEIVQYNINNGTEKYQVEYGSPSHHCPMDNEMRYIEKFDQYMITSDKDSFMRLHAVDLWIIPGCKMEPYKPFNPNSCEINKLQIKNFYSPDYEYKQFNPIYTNKGEILCSSISKYTLALIFNYYYYKHGWRHDKGFVKDYERFFLKINNDDKSQLKKLGWRIIKLNRSSLFNSVKDARDGIYMDEENYKHRFTSHFPYNFVACYPEYKLKPNLTKLPIPHKCLSPFGDEILFVGSLEEPGVANVYSLNLNNNIVETVFNAQDNSFEFNPDLDWTEHGILITCKDAIYFKYKPDIEKLNIDSSIKELRYGRISPSGNEIIFTGKKDRNIYLFFYDTRKHNLLSKYLGKGEIDDYQIGWICKEKITTIKKEADYYYLPVTETMDAFAFFNDLYFNRLPRPPFDDYTEHYHF